MKVCIIFLLSFFLGTSAESADRYVYQSYEESRENFVDEFSILVGDVVHDRRIVQLREKTKKYLKEEEYVLDLQWATLSWSSKDPKEKNDYHGRREGEYLFVKGKFHGRLIDKKIPIGKEPFYFNPKLGLRYFMSVPDTNMEFWAVRHDTLGEFKMTAEKQGQEMIEVRGEEVLTEKIYWHAKVDIAKLFKRTYWMRVSDGVYVKQTGSNKPTRVLVQESHEE